MPAVAMKPKAEMQRIIEEPHGLKEDEQVAESAGELKLFRPLANLISGSYAQTKSWNVVGPVVSIPPAPLTNPPHTLLKLCFFDKIGNLENRVNSMFPETIEKLGNATQPLIENLDKKTAPLAGSMRASLLSRIQNVQDQLQHVSAACTHQKANLYTFANEVVENANATAKPAYEKVQAVNKQVGTKIVDAVSAVTHSIGQIQEVLTPKGASLNRELRSRVHQAILAATHLSSQSATVLKGLSLDVKKKGPRGSAEAVKQALSSSVAFILHAPHEFVLALKEHEQQEHEQHDNKSPDDEVNRVAFVRPSFFFLANRFVFLF